ncbi:MAG TPA: DUF192 domain-containing protein [Bacillota bacterium]|nr:DUF192 domain-containing protein [Bacillota bacterium]
MGARLVNRDNQQVVASDLELAYTFFSRLKGLMGRPSLAPGHGLEIRPCNSVHTCFMRFELDLLFLDANRRILHLERAMRPWRLSRIVKGAVMVIELPAGTIAAAGCKEGQLLELLINPA